MSSIVSRVRCNEIRVVSPFLPRIHMHCEESIIDLSQINDGLPKLPKGAAEI